MEERIIDKDDEKLIRLRRTEEGETDAADPLAEEEDGEEILLEAGETADGEESEEEYDEDLVGLTPSQLEKELERRKKAEEEARAACAKLVEDAEAAFSRGEYAQAASLYEQASCYSFADGRISQGLWRARSSDFTDLEALLKPAVAEEFAEADGATKAFVRERVAEKLAAEEVLNKREKEEIAPDVLAKQETRREAFADNRKYYAVRFLAFVFILLAALVGTAVSAYFIVRTTSIAPVIVTAVFGAVALCMLVLAFVYSRKVLVAARLCRENDRLSSTEEGARLEYLQNRLYCLDLFLRDREEEAGETAEE